MKFQNEGTIDRMARIVFGIALLSLVFVGPESPWGWIGVVPLVTGVVGWCPLYGLLRLNTCSKKKARNMSHVTDRTAI